MSTMCEHIPIQVENSEGCVHDYDELELIFFPNIKDTCKYYTDAEFTSNIETAGSFSLIHLNCRSLYSNFSKIHDYLNTLQNKFTVIALSETWLTDEKGVEFHFEGYELFYVNRIYKRGGGVALYVSSDLKCKIIECMTTAIADLMECLTVEIEMKKQRNIFVTCIYRTPGSSITVFNNKLEQLLVGMNENKVSVICGDFNINLLNVSNHTSSLDFLDLMYSRGFYPTITRPSRITSSCATLIDNIFVNKFEKTVKSGLLINDTTDHFPIFVTYFCEIKTNKEKFSKVIRLRTEETLNGFRDDLMKEQWNNVCNTKNVNKAYELFLKKYLWLYNKNCPIKIWNDKVRNNNKPWLTKGILKSCKKKNKLYRDFVKYRTENAEKKYKAYKNKLTTIMRCAKKDYYTNVLMENKSNIKRMWNVLREVMGSKINYSQPLYLMNEQNVEISGEKMADEFNSFFVNVGPNLAKTIPFYNENKSWTGESRVMQSFFLDEVSESEIISTVSKLKSKCSCDSDGLDRYIVKETICCIIRPLKYIINLSFNTGSFPEKMKVARIIPLFNLAIGIVSQIIGLYLCFLNFQKFWRSFSLKNLIVFLKNIL
ncbi:DNA-directed RNA polymerase subunit omega [Labeo rohita]|uniref:DNA-directed RNA polymerase subunit omega n=1 Tax=Labeo rohita TaxID=84645 RepID=A0ABQ8L9T1_LABRO|nr:DNA-directed RNA polymerase subunit omega [Labeo rohita]